MKATDPHQSSQAQACRVTLKVTETMLVSRLSKEPEGSAAAAEIRDVLGRTQPLEFDTNEDLTRKVIARAQVLDPVHFEGTSDYPTAELLAAFLQRVEGTILDPSREAA